MKRDRIWLYLLMAILSASLFYYGEFVLTDETFKMISGLCIGLGAAIFCLSIGNFIGSLIISKTESEELTRKKKIEVITLTNYYSKRM